MGARLQLRTDIPAADFLRQVRWQRLVRHCIEPRADLQLLVPAQAFKLELLESDSDRRACQEDGRRVHEVLASEFITEQRHHIQNVLDT